MFENEMVKSHLMGETVFTSDKRFNFYSFFNLKNGFYFRSNVMQGSQKTEEDPFMGSYPSLLDIGIMGTCLHGKKGLCIKSGVECYQSGLIKSEKDMSLADFTSIIEQIRGRVFQVALGGRGDPNKHANFREILEICRKNYVIPNYTTSGYDLTDEEVEITKKSVGAVAVSEYKTPHTLRAIEKFVAAGVKTNLHYVIGQHSIQEVLARLETGDFYPGLNAIIFLLHKPVGLGKDRNILDLGSMQKLLHYVDTKKFSFKVGFDACCVPGIVNFSKNINPASIDTCEAARFSAYISADMKMLPCSFDIEDQRWSFDLRHGSVSEAWNSLSFDNFRQSLRNSCSSCATRANCMGGCPIKGNIVLCDKPEKNKV